MPPRDAIAAIRGAVGSADPRWLKDLEITSLEDGPLRLWRAMIDTLAGFAGTLAAIALALAMGGIYGVVAYLASIRRQEIGIRMALGAGRADVFRLILADGLAPVVAGALTGLGAALVISTLLRASLSFPGTPDVLFGVSAFDLLCWRWSRSPPAPGPCGEPPASIRSSRFDNPERRHLPAVYCLLPFGLLPRDHCVVVH